MVMRSELAAVSPGQLAAEEVGNFLYDALEAEIGGFEVYLAALPCAIEPELRAEWETSFARAKEHVETLEKVLFGLGLDPDRDTPGRRVVRHIGKSLVNAMHLALGSLTADEAQIVAAQCIVHAQTKDHANWELIGRLLAAGVVENDVLAEVLARIAQGDGERLSHSRSWCRELRSKSLGLPARLPPPERIENLESAEEAVPVRR